MILNSLFNTAECEEDVLALQLEILHDVDCIVKVSIFFISLSWQSWKKIRKGINAANKHSS